MVSLVPLRAQTPSEPELIVNPWDARVWLAKVALLTIGVPET
jgi:hypothetical protein